MPILSIELTIVHCRKSDGLTHVRALEFPEFSVVDSSARAARQSLIQLLRSHCEKMSPSNLLARRIDSPPSLGKHSSTFVAPKRDLAWRVPATRTLPLLSYQVRDGLTCHNLPSMGLTLLSDNPHALDKLIQNQVLATFRRNDYLKLRGIFQLPEIGVIVLNDVLTLSLKTPSERYARRRQEGRGNVSGLKQYCRRLQPGQMPPAFHRQVEVERLADLLREPMSTSVLLVGTSGVGKTAIFQQCVRNSRDLQLSNNTFWSTDGTSIVAGMTGFGMKTPN